MTRLAPDQEWWTAEEIAAAALPDMPGTKRGVNLHIDANDWRSQAAFARRRAGKGGGWEYSWRLFPARARRKLLSDVAPRRAAGPRSRDEVWAWYEKLPASVQQKAQERLKVIQEVEALERADGKHAAIAAVAAARVIGARTIWGWFALIEGVRVDDRLPYLAPRNRAAEQRGSKPKDCDPEFFDLIKSDYLRSGPHGFTDSYRLAVGVAEKRGLAILPERTMRRRLDAAVSRPMQVLAREGIDALKRMYPVQVRDKTALGAMEAVNADFHKFDVFVRWPSAPGEKPQILRPQLVAFQDIHSGRILSWRVDVSANSTAVLLAAGDMISTWGIPEHVLLDNGREFAAKSITGGASTRYRFKVKEDDIPGLFTQLGCVIHWATPYSGQSKTIERAWLDLSRTVPGDPRLAGAWTGRSVDSQPEDYGSRAVDLELFLTVVAEKIEEHNTRQGRRSEVACGRSFAEVFDESYAQRPIKKATEAQRRFWLMGAEGVRADTNTGAVWFQRNEFWADWMHEIAGERVVIRFDPAAFWDGIHVYSADNRYLGHAPVRQKAGFFDMDEARTHARARAAWIKAERERLAAHRRLSALELSQAIEGIAAPVASPMEAKVVRPTFGKPAAKAKVSRATQPAGVSAEELSRAQDRVVADLAARRAPKPAEETDRERFRRALQIEDALKAGEAVTPEQQRWASMFLASPPGKAERQLWDQYGNEIFG